MSDLSNHSLTRRALLAQQAEPPARRGRKGDEGEGQNSIGSWAASPRNSVFLVLILALVVGGGRKLLQGLRGRRAANRLAGPEATPSEIESAAEHGRSALIELFELLGPEVAPERRQAAGRALARLWARDELIAEEEKAIVSRGYAVSWHARRRYPRGLKAPIPVAVEFGVPFLDPEGGGVKPADLDWSGRVAGSRRATLERFGPWRAGPARLEFSIEPADFAGEGPHMLALHAKARVQGLTTPWELDLPAVPFRFELDPRLEIDSILTLPDETRGQALAHALSWQTIDRPEEAEPKFLPLARELALVDPPELRVVDPPCDLAHTAWLEVEGRPGRIPAGFLAVSRDRLAAAGADSAHFPLSLAPEPPEGLIESPGEIRIRLVLIADPHRAWADPDLRALWPGELITPWTSARVVRL